MKTIIVGLGNPILGDDGVGWKVAEELRCELCGDALVEVECLSLGGIGLMEHLIGYDRAIIIDSFAAPAEDTGSILVRKLDDLPDYSAYHITSAHDTSLQNAIRLGREMGAHLPDEIAIVGITTTRIHDFTENLSPLVEQAVPYAVHMVIDLLKMTALESEKQGRP